MLIKCPECELQVSDKAIHCPHCGNPMSSKKRGRKPQRGKRRKRLPNGFGQISEIKGRNLRKPFRAMISTGKMKTGKPICEPLKPTSYFETYNDAYAALVEYHRNPYDLDPNMTMQDLFDKWSSRHFERLKTEGSISSYENAWKYCSQIYPMRVSDVRSRHMKGCIENGFVEVKGEKRIATSSIKSIMKTLFNLMFDFALEYDLVDRNRARNFSLDLSVEEEETSIPHIPFTDEEMAVLWSHVNDTPYVDAILIQCYSGWRPQELCRLSLSDVDIENWKFGGGMKTPSGFNRVVPIHSKIRDLVAKRYNDEKLYGGKNLFSCDDGYDSVNGRILTYSKYRTRFTKVMKQLGLNQEHRPHDPRVHFITQAKKHNVDEYVLKLLVGHKIKDVTEKYYTKRDLEWLRTEIEKIEKETLPPNPSVSDGSV